VRTLKSESQNKQTKPLSIPNRVQPNSQQMDSVLFHSHLHTLPPLSSAVHRPLFQPPTAAAFPRSSPFRRLCPPPLLAANTLTANSVSVTLLLLLLLLLLNSYPVCKLSKACSYDSTEFPLSAAEPLGLKIY